MPMSSLLCMTVSPAPIHLRGSKAHLGRTMTRVLTRRRVLPVLVGRRWNDQPLWIH
jgi:hypothetical protein